jgi:hypothetical protein
MNRLEKKFKIMTAAAALSACLAMPGMAVFAATATVTASDVNVRADASTTADIVGTAASGEAYDIGEEKQDADGNTWYQITLADGSVGYIRNDFVTVSDDTATTGTTDSAAADSTEAAATTDTSSTDTGDYSIQNAPDENGDYYYYLYDNAAGKRMKIDDIETLQTQVTDLQSQVASAGNRYRVLIIVLAVLLVAAVAAAIAMFVRLRDALTNGRRERDLTSERRQERNANPEADNLDSLRRTAPRTRDPRNSAYPSGQARDPQREGVRRPAPQQRPVQGETGRAPVRGTADGRPVQQAPREGVRRPVTNGTQGQAVRRPVQPGQQPVRRPVQPQGQQAPYREAAAQQREQAPQQRRPVQQQGQQAPYREQQPVRRPAQNPASNPQPQQQAARQKQARDFAGDDDFDYDFISLDDNK